MLSPSPVPIGGDSTSERDPAMGNFRVSAALALAFLAAAVVASSSVQAQPWDTATASKRIQVLRIVEASTATRPQSPNTSAKKKLALKKTIRQMRGVSKRPPPTHLADPDPPVQPASTSARTTPTADDIPERSTVETGHTVEFASSFGEDDSAGVLASTQDGPDKNGAAIANVPRLIAAGREAYILEVTGQTQIAPTSSNNSILQIIATLGGAMVACAFGWYLVKSSPRHAFG